MESVERCHTKDTRDRHPTRLKSVSNLPLHRSGVLPTAALSSCARLCITPANLPLHNSHLLTTIHSNFSLALSLFIKTKVHTPLPTPQTLPHSPRDRRKRKLFSTMSISSPHYTLKPHLPGPKPQNSKNPGNLSSSASLHVRHFPEQIACPSPIASSDSPTQLAALPLTTKSGRP